MRYRRALEESIFHVTGERFKVRSVSPVHGGCIHNAYRISDGSRNLFAKTNDREKLPMFEAEAYALAELARADGPRVPKVVWVGELDGDAVLLLEFMELKPIADNAASALGEALAALHSVSASRFGWNSDNFIGTTPQPNTPDENWSDFFRDRRIGFQLQLAAQAGFADALAERGEHLLDVLDKLMVGHRPVPSLVHGDLWAGNAAQDASGAPVIFDPASYYGDRETDLAMTELFGGFGSEFRRAYEAAWPLEPGYPVRRTLYNLYHVLNHLNLFGESYLHGATQSIDWLLSEAGA